MAKTLRWMMVWVMLLCSFMHGLAQIAMPDTVCVGTSRLYHVNTAASLSTYTWKIDGAIQASIRNEINVTWTTAGVFNLSVQEHAPTGCEGDVRSGLVYVINAPVANAGADTAICLGNSVRLNGSGGGTYEWSPSVNLSNPNVANPLFYAALPGLYHYNLSVKLANGCGAAIDDGVTIRVLPKPVIFAGNDTTVAINQPLQLNAEDINSTGFTNYAWSPPFGLSNSSIQNPVVSFSSLTNATYTVTAKSPQGCVAKDDISITVFLAPDIFVPSGFTPNGDNLNDLLRPTLIGIKNLKHFTVYNRFGQMVFTTSTPKAGWDGRINGVMQNTANFVWTAEAVDYNGNTLVRKGYAVLIK